MSTEASDLPASNCDECGLLFVVGHATDCVWYRPSVEAGVEKRYTVKRTDGRDAPGQKHDGCEYFVLDLTHDAAARAAAMAYARSVGGENPQLLIDLVDQVSRLDGARSPATKHLR